MSRWRLSSTGIRCSSRGDDFVFCFGIQLIQSKLPLVEQKLVYVKLDALLIAIAVIGILMAAVLGWHLSGSLIVLIAVVAMTTTSLRRADFN